MVISYSQKLFNLKLNIWHLSHIIFGSNIKRICKIGELVFYSSFKEVMLILYVCKRLPKHFCSILDILHGQRNIILVNIKCIGMIQLFYQSLNVIFIRNLLHNQECKDHCW